MKKDQSASSSSGGEGVRGSGGSTERGGGEASGTPSLRPSDREVLETALRTVGLDGEGLTAFCDAALVVGAMTQGRRSAQVDLGFVGESAAAAEAVGGRPSSDAAPRSMESHLSEADRTLTAMEAIASCSMRLDAAMVAAAREQTTAVGSALLAERDVAEPGELSATARERWRARAKRRTREEIGPAIGWTQGETAHLVGLAMAPVAFSMPVVTLMSRGLLPWRLARALWRACEGLDAADAAHVATVMCGDDPATCVPERLASDGSVLSSPWEHRAFWTALAREVAKITAADDADPADAQAERAAREAAYAGRGVYGKVNEDGTGSVTVVTSAFWVGAIMDRLDKAARAARLAGDERTLDQLRADIARTLLAISTVGFADLPDLSRTSEGPGADGEEGGGAGEAARPTDEDLIRAGWSPELIQALSGLPAAVLQVIVPLLGLHDPATSDTLPTVGRSSTRPDPNTPTQTDRCEQPAQDAQRRPGAEDEHTGQAGCPSCAPSRRARSTGEAWDDLAHDPQDDRGRHADDRGRHAQDHAGGDAHDRRAHHHDEETAHDPERKSDQDDREDPARRARRLWVGELMGAFRMFVSPSQVRQLALAPGTTLARLLVDPADGRCVERSITTYRMDAAMRAQLLASDVTCRAPGCHHHGAACQVDHVTEYGTPGGVTSESNGQLLHTGHHEAKTAKAWDAELAANRDMTWTSLLGRIYKTRAWDYRRYVTLLVDAIDAVRSAPPEDQAAELDRQVYLALAHRDLGERLNPGDDDLDPDILRFGGWNLVALTHRDRHTGERVPGPSEEATTEILASRAAHLPDPASVSSADPEPEEDGAAPERIEDIWDKSLPAEKRAYLTTLLENLIYFSDPPDF